MYLSSIQLKNFRKFATVPESDDGITVHFHQGINALIGENDAGKSAIIDAIKLVLKTQSGEYIQLSDDDFHISNDGTQASEFSIDCVFTGFDDNEAKNFVEWLSFKRDKSTGALEYTLSLSYIATQSKGRLHYKLKARTVDSYTDFDERARALLSCIYLRPLRDASREMRNGRNSRISQILQAHPIFGMNDDNELVKLLSNTNKEIEKYFSEDGGRDILKNIRDTMDKFLAVESEQSASFKIAQARLKPILECLSLVLDGVQSGLGVQNLLFIAAELLLLNNEDDGALKLALIEELEAHLHPQAQLRLISYLQEKYNNSAVQVIISTHSPILASKIHVKNLILIKNSCAYDLIPEHTKLSEGDYLHLHRFLDSCKSNLFFAKGIMMVEGDAENILIPVLADILGCNLEQYGISIVNVHHIGFFRYANIFLRADGRSMEIPISIITDCDVKPYKDDAGIELRDEDSRVKILEKEKKYNNGAIKVFVAPHWTFEFSIALGSLREVLYKSILQAEKIQNSDNYTLTEEKITKIDAKVARKRNEWEGISAPKIAYEIYDDNLLERKVSKAIVAQCMANNLRRDILNSPSMPQEKMFDIDLYQSSVDSNKRNILKNKIQEDESLSYIVMAIKHAAGIE